MQKYTKKIHQILRPNGIILINACGSDPNGWEGYNKDWFGMPMFWSYYEPKRTLKIIANAGFEILWSQVIKAGGEKQFWVLAKNIKKRKN